MNKSLLISMLVAIVLIGVVVYFLTSKGGMNNTQTVAPTQNAAVSPTEVTQKAVTETPQPTGASVSYTSTGFVPKSVSVKVGDTVTWTNNDTNDMWVASNPHPTHTDYPGFDAKKPYKTGEMYTFTFTKAGTWGYHNHFKPGTGGEVVVTK